MIPYLFESTYSNAHSIFTGHGIGDLVDIIEAKAKESSDDGHEWELEFTYPETGELFSSIQNNAIVVAKVNPYQGLQAFRIYSITKELNHRIKVSCQHISYDLSNILVKPFKAESSSEAINKMVSNKAFSLPFDHFTYSTNIPDPTPDPSTDANTLEFSEPRSIRSVLLDGDDSIVGKYGGDVLIDNYSISIMSVGGTDRGETIEYGKDLTSFSQEVNIGEMITGIYPYCQKNTRNSLSIQSTINKDVTTTNTAMVTASSAYTLEAGQKYKLSFYTENTGVQAYINSSCGFLASGATATFTMDGYRHDFEIEVSENATYSSGTVIIYSGAIAPSSGSFGEIYSMSVSSSPIEPLIYGDIAYGPGTYDIQKIEAVDLTKFFPDDPTVSELNAKAAEWVSKEEIGIPDIDLTLSYANIDQNIHIYDAVRVRFLRMNVDVKAKVTSYEYDVLKERITSITVGRTKESLYFTLEDASRLKRGVLPPDRIGKKSITSDKYAKGSVNSEAIGPAAVGSYNIESYSINEEALSDKAVSLTKLKSWGTDPVLQSVPANVYGGYRRNVGYLLDPALGMPDEGFPGWTDTNDEWHSIVNPYSRNISVDNKSGIGYVMNPDCLANETITNKKVADEAITERTIASLAVTGAKIADLTISESKMDNHLQAKMAAWQSIYDNVGPLFDTTATEPTTFTVLAAIINYLTFRGNITYSPGTGVTYQFSMHTLYVNGVKQAYILSDQDVNITVPNI